jgi:hypothetical protein
VAEADAANAEVQGDVVEGSPLTVAQLRELAAEEEIDLEGATRKDDIRDKVLAGLPNVASLRALARREGVNLHGAQTRAEIIRALGGGPEAHNISAREDRELRQAEGHRIVPQVQQPDESLRGRIPGNDPESVDHNNTPATGRDEPLKMGDQEQHHGGTLPEKLADDPALRGHHGTNPAHLADKAEDRGPHVADERHVPGSMTNPVEGTE